MSHCSTDYRIIWSKVLVSYGCQSGMAGINDESLQNKE